MSPDFMTVDHFLQVVQEEVDQMVEDEGLILKHKFPVALRVRLQQKIRDARVAQSGQSD